ncbi:hypothetical protein FQZ97_1056020 [compost metagenome]
MQLDQQGTIEQLPTVHCQLARVRDQTFVVGGLLRREQASMAANLADARPALPYWLPWHGEFDDLELRHGALLA